MAEFPVKRRGSDHIFIAGGDRAARSSFDRVGDSARAAGKLNGGNFIQAFFLVIEGEDRADPFHGGHGLVAEILVLQTRNSCEVVHEAELPFAVGVEIQRRHPVVFLAGEEGVDRVADGDETEPGVRGEQ